MVVALILKAQLLEWAFLSLSGPAGGRVPSACAPAQPHVGVYGLSANELRSTPAAIRLFEFVMGLLASETRVWWGWNLMVAKSIIPAELGCIPADFLPGRRAVSSRCYS